MTANTFTTWELAHMAGTADPDAPDLEGFDAEGQETWRAIWPARGFDVEGSPGAAFLRSVEDSYRAWLTEDDGDAARMDMFPTESLDADNMGTTVYTGERWAVFENLAAWRGVEPVTGGAGEDAGLWTDGDDIYQPRDMSDLAGQVLARIAWRLALALGEADVERATREGGAK